MRFDFSKSPEPTASRTFCTRSSCSFRAFSRRLFNSASDVSWSSRADTECVRSVEMGESASAQHYHVILEEPHLSSVRWTRLDALHGRARLHKAAVVELPANVSVFVLDLFKAPCTLLAFCARCSCPNGCRLLAAGSIGNYSWSRTGQPSTIAARVALHWHRPC